VRPRIWIAVFFAFAMTSASLVAQWDPRLPPGVPKNAKGEPDLNGPVPRTADGKPDFAGVWQGVGALGAAQANTGDAASGPPLAAFRDVAQNIKGGAPLNAAGAAILAERRAANSKDNPEANCLPMGIVQFHTQGAPRKFIQTAGLLVILYEASSGLRQIFTDGRPLPANDPQPWWYGYSVGKWDGDTLVVETTGFRDGGWLDINGTPLTDAGKLTERFRRVSYGRMEIDVTIEDPKVYTRPWTVRVNQRLMPDQELIEFICLENQRFGAQ
jgi:hypothetical protein